RRETGSCVSWRTLRLSGTAPLRTANVNDSVGKYNVRGRFTAHPGEFVNTTSRWSEPWGLAGVHETLWASGLWLRTKTGLAGRRRGRPDARRDAIGFQLNWKIGLRSQPGDVSRVVVHNHPKSSLQFSFIKTNSAARIGRYVDASNAELTSESG